MKEHFLTYEQSLEVKELGFPQNDYLAWFDSRNVLYFDSDYVCKDYAPTCCSAPLKSQFFKWVREKYGYNGVVEGDKKYGYEWCIYNDYDKYIKPPNNYKNYEEAEDACINKIIEILKSKQ